MDRLFGLVLAGGKSSRMGFDKRNLIFHQKPQDVFLLELLEKYCDKVFISCKEGQTTATNQNTIFDCFEINSPLNGILSAFTSHAPASWLTVPVDMPGIDEEIIEYLLNNRDIEKLATCFFDSSGKYPEPLLAIWEKACLPQLLDFSTKGGVSPRDFLKASPIKMLQAPFARLHANINTQDDLALWKKQRLS
jgi:molybdopterin-guanine dinucleotide biosynthesis protein A